MGRGRGAPPGTSMVPKPRPQKIYNKDEIKLTKQVKQIGLMPCILDKKDERKKAVQANLIWHKIKDVKVE